MASAALVQAAGVEVVLVEAQVVPDLVQHGNADLAQNIMLWLSAVDDAIAVRPRTTGGTLIFFTPSGRSALTFVVVLLVPTLIAMVAAAWASLRRHR